MIIFVLEMIRNHETGHSMIVYDSTSALMFSKKGF